MMRSLYWLLYDNINEIFLQEVQTLVGSVYRTSMNIDRKTPQELFTNEHAELREKREIWMKERANQCMVVATLIATITFAGAFTLPGGNKSDNGNSIFMKRSAFIVFVVGTPYL